MKFKKIIIGSAVAGTVFAGSFAAVVAVQNATEQASNSKGFGPSNAPTVQQYGPFSREVPAAPESEPASQDGPVAEPAANEPTETPVPVEETPEPAPQVSHVDGGAPAPATGGNHPQPSNPIPPTITVGF